jgi:hypothetical protein
LAKEEVLFGTLVCMRAQAFTEGKPEQGGKPITDGNREDEPKDPIKEPLSITGSDYGQC